MDTFVWNELASPNSLQISLILFVAVDQWSRPVKQTSGAWELHFRLPAVSSRKYQHKNPDSQHTHQIDLKIQSLISLRFTYSAVR